MATTTTKFKALGAGNGFAGPIRKSDDPSFDSTLASPLTFSLEQVMELFWLMEGASAISGGSWTVNTSSSEREHHPNLPASWTVSVGLDKVKFSSGGGFLPKDRVKGAISTNTQADSQGSVKGSNILELGDKANPAGGFSYSEPTQDPYVAGSDGIEAHFSIGFGGGIQIIEDASSTSKNRYGIMSNLYSRQESNGYFFSTFTFQQDYNMTAYDPRVIEPGAIDQFDGTISIGAFTLYAWYPYYQGGGGNIGDATVPSKSNQPRISAFEKYILA